MTWKRIFAVVVAGLLLASPRALVASPLECIGPESRPGEVVLTDLQKRYEQVKTFRGKFIQWSTLAALERTERSTGEVLFARPGKMRWDYLDPERQSVVVADAEVQFYQEDLRQVMEEQLDQVLMTDLPISFLLGLGDLAKSFSVVGVCRRDREVVLSLRARDDSLGELKLLISPEGKVPRAALIRDISGNETLLQLHNIEENVALPTESFVLRLPPGVDRIRGTTR